MKTPISLIQGPLKELINKKDSLSESEINHQLELIQRNSERLDILVDQVLEVTRIRAGVTQKEIEPLDVKKVFDEVIDHFQSHFDQKQIQYRWIHEHSGMFVLGNKNDLERIFINLISNALKFSKAGGLITYSCEVKEESVHLKVIDNGIGIPKNEHSNIFEYLYQVEGNSTTGGTGIGLYLVKSLVEKMSGSVHVSSKLGEGACFEVVLPIQNPSNFINPSLNVKHAQNGEEEGQSTSDGSGSANINHLENTKPKILVVEDNLDFREYIAFKLSPFFEVYQKADGVDALTFLESTMVDLIITDIMMPQMNGIEFVERIRQRENFHQIPVIILSAKEDERTIKTGLSTGADLYLTKPINGGVLISQVNALLRREEKLKKGDHKVEGDPLKTKVVELIYRHLGNTNLSVNILADALYMSRSKLYAEWSKEERESITQLIRTTRMEEAHSLLKSKSYNIKEVAIAVGYTNTNYFSTSFKKHFGYSPSEIVNTP